MKYERLIIEKEEFVILKQLLNLEGHYKGNSIQKHLHKLQEELREAIVLDEDDMYADVIRLNSTVTINSDNWKNTFQLVQPSLSNPTEKKISVLLPMGAAVLGYAKGDTIHWEFPGGTKQLEVVDVQQVEGSMKTLK